MPNLTTQPEVLSFRVWVKRLETFYDNFERKVENYIAAQRAVGRPEREILAELEADKNSGRAIFNEFVGGVEREMDWGMNTEFQVASNVPAKPLPEGFEMVKWTLNPSAEHCDSCLYQAKQPARKITEIPIPGSQPTVGEDNCTRYCFTEENLVDVRGVEKAYRSEYEGSVLEITTLGGMRLTGTPNHPILTPTGFIALQFLKDGDEVLCCPLGKGMLAVEPDVYNAPPTIKEVFESLAVSGECERGVGRTMDFYGDGRENGEVNIVTVDSVLRDCVDSVLAEIPGEQGLSGCAETQSRLIGQSLSEKFFIGSDHSTDGVMGGLGKFQAFGGTELGHSEVHGRGSAPDWNTVNCENAINDGTGAVIVSGERERGFSGPVSGDDLVLGLRIAGGAEFSGNVFIDRIVGVHSRPVGLVSVYTFQTASGIYNVGGIIASNCRCSLEPVVKIERDAA